jgi:ABC-type transporter Mla MlaB component
MHDAGTEASQASEGAVLALPAELTIYTVGELHPAWRTWAETGGQRVDGTAVDQVDAAGLQLLLALARSLQARGKPLRLVGSSRALDAGCAALGLAAWLAQQHEGTPA